MLELESQLVKIKHINTRNEKHGEDNVLSVDLKLQARVSNDLLAQFSPTLKSSFYYKDESVQGDLVSDAAYLPNLKNPALGAVKWDGDWEHQLLRILSKVRPKDDILLEDARVNKLSFDFQEGGTVFINFRVQAYPDEKTTARILQLLGQEVHMSLSFQEPEQMKEAA